MFARRARALLQHWSTQPGRSGALVAFIVLLALGGPVGCWLHCRGGATGAAHGAGHAGTLAGWARQSSEHSQHTAQSSGHSRHTEAAEHTPSSEIFGCAEQHSSLSALTVGVVALLALLIVPRARRRNVATAYRPLFDWVKAPLVPPPRRAFSPSIAT